MNVLEELNYYYNHYRFIKGVLAKTPNGNGIYYFRVRKTDGPVLLVQYSIHAREYITTYLALKQIDDYLMNGERGTVYFIPCMNPDGVNICLKNDPLYKANGREVDLNVNFDAGFGRGRSNTFYKNGENYVGKRPFSETESKALKDFTEKIKPDMTVSYHSKGEEIYYEFNQSEEDKKKHYLLAKSIERATGYKIKSTPYSFGGYKDWCIKKYNIPSFTVEVGDDNLTHPIGKEHIDEIYEKNKKVLKNLIEEYEKIYRPNRKIYE